MTPKYASVKGWCELSGMSRTGTFAALGRQDLTAKKQGRKTLIDVEAGLAWLRSLPQAVFRPPSNGAAA